MSLNLLTIHVDEIFEVKCGCPVCRIRNMLENRCAEYITGDAMMQPDIRIQTNKLGFCSDHYSLLLKQKNRLSLALILDTHLNEVRKNIFDSKNPFINKADKSNKINESCFICENVNPAMKNLVKGIFTLYSSDKNFRNSFKEQEYICLVHYKTLCENAKSYLSKSEAKSFINDATQLVKAYIEELNNDVHHFTEMFDYRNSGAGADWENSKDSIERTVNFLTSKNL